MARNESTVLELKWQGPLKNRRCTDLPCFFIFFLFLIFWFGLGYYALSNGDSNRYLTPIDSKGRKCGVDSAVIDKPVLVFFDITKCLYNWCNTTQVCQPKCPQKNWYFIPTLTSLEDAYENMICEDGININGKSVEELNQLIELKVCTKWHLESISIMKRCIPKLIPSDVSNYTIGSEALRNAIKVMKVTTSISSIYNEIVIERYSILLFSFNGMMVSLLYIILFRWITVPLAWTGIIFFIVLLAYLAYVCYDFYVLTQSIGWIIGASILGGLAILIAIIVLCICKQILLACQFIKETSKATFQVISIFFLPILTWLINLGVIIYFIVIGIWLTSIEYRSYTIKGNISSENCQCPTKFNNTIGNVCEPNKFYEVCHENNGSCFSRSCHLNASSIPSLAYYTYGLHIFGFFWLYFFIFDLKKITVASTYATWYWTFRKSDVPFFTTIVSMYRVIRYHLGTVAFGSLVIAICRFIRVILEYMNSILASKYFQNPNISCITKCNHYCNSCCMYLLEKVFKFLTTNAYIMCAISGKGLCTSAADALSLIIKNIIRAMVLSRIINWLFLLGKILIISLITLSAWYWYKENKNDETREYWYIPIILIGILSYLISTIFFSVYSIGVDTIFLCALQDCEYNDGSKEKPYYMNRRIGKLLKVYK